MSWNVTFWIGVVLLACGTLLAVREHQWIRTAQVAHGKVTELVPTRNAKGRTTYAPRVSFVALDGSSHEFVRGFGSNPPGFQVGDQVTVAYHAPTFEGRILSFGQRFGFPAVLSILGLAILGLAATFLVGQRFVPSVYLHMDQALERRLP